MYEKWAGGSPEAPGCNFEFKDTGDQRQTGRGVARAFLPAIRVGLRDWRYPCPIGIEPVLSEIEGRRRLS